MMNVRHSEPTASARYSRLDWCIAASVFVTALALRIPFRSQFAYHWDSAQFVLAIREYDIRLSQPHAPGYFLYILLGRLVNGFLGDPHASLIWISVVFGSALPAVVYLLATAMFGRKAGVTAGLLTLTSPQVWFHSCVALTYCVDSFLVCTVVLVLWRAMERGGEWKDAVLVGVLLAVAGGVRPQSVPMLGPLVVFVFWRFKNARVGKLILTAVVTVGCGILWLAPMVQTSGGLKTYLEIVRLHTAANASATFLGGGWDALLKNVANVTGFCWNGLWLGAVVLVGALLYRMFRMSSERKRVWENRYRLQLAVLAFWIVPMMAFGVVVGFTKQPGYVLSYLPGWFLLIGEIVASLQSKWIRATVIAVICTGNVVAFADWPPAWDGIFLGMARTAREIAEHDAQLLQITRAIRQAYSPQNIVVCFSEEYYLCGLRHFQLYLPEYDQYQFVVDGTILHPPGKPMWLVRGGRLTFVDKLDMTGKEGIVLVVPPGENVNVFAPYLSLASAKDLPQSERDLYFVPKEAVKLLP